MTCLNQAITNILAKIDNPRDPPVAYILGSKKDMEIERRQILFVKEKNIFTESQLQYFCSLSLKQLSINV